MKCANCPCSCVELDDWNCMAHMEDNMCENEDGCDLAESEATTIALAVQESHMTFLENYLDWLGIIHE